jgi:hypothetical protein
LRLDGGFADWLIMPGRVPHDEVESWYSLIDICPFPRKPWPVCEMVSPMKPLEALAMEKAVVVSDVRALAEMITDEADRPGLCQGRCRAWRKRWRGCSTIPACAQHWAGRAAHGCGRAHLARGGETAARCCPVPGNPPNPAASLAAGGRRMIELTPFIRQLRRRMAALTPGPNRFAIRTGTVPVHFRVHFVPGATGMLVTFHGATCRARREAPMFNGFNPDLADCTQVAVSDPSLQVPGDFGIAWFAGHRDSTRLPAAPGLCRNGQGLGMERTIFFGTSGGGFAALAQSHAMPGSIAVVGNPQTRIARYHAPLVAAYRQACWPDLADNAELDGVTMADCNALYGAGFRNLVVYIQSLGDKHHRAHMLPFAAAIAGLAQADRVLFHSDFHGLHGHGLPREAYADWLRAAVISPTATPADLLDTWHALRRRATPVPRQRASAPKQCRARPSPAATTAPRRRPAPGSEAGWSGNPPHPRKEGCLMRNPYRGRDTRVLVWRGGAAPPGRHGRPVGPDCPVPRGSHCHGGQLLCPAYRQCPGRARGAFPGLRATAAGLCRCGRGAAVRLWRVFVPLWQCLYRAADAATGAGSAGPAAPGARPCGNAKGALRCAAPGGGPGRPCQPKPCCWPAGCIWAQCAPCWKRWMSGLHAGADRMLGKLADGTVYPTAPGTLAGSFDPDLHAFRNLRHGEVLADMAAFWALLKEVNPGALLLTVSPVPLVATASEGHVLPATVYSKSVLRAVAGDLAADHADIAYFPSYEIITGHPSRGMFFNPDLRTVNAMGVDLVMRHFFTGRWPAPLPPCPARAPRSDLRRKPDRRNAL